MRLPVLLLLVLSAFSESALTAPLAPEDAPPPLRDWVGWVLDGHEDQACPHLYNSHKLRRCAWPSRLELDLNAGSGRFEQSWEVYLETWIKLPGDAKRWPQEVSVNGKPVSVAQHQGGPALRLPPGTHRVRGRFQWERLPESLQVPRDTGLIALRVNAKDVERADLNAKGELWLREKDAERSEREAESDRLEIEVFRKLIDEIPSQVLTRIELKISGGQREVLLGRALMRGYTPVRLDSPLPARLEPDERLRVQVRPGHWTIELLARYPREATRMALAASPEPWPQEEIWVFDARNYLRLVEVEGIEAIDPRQTNLPENWRNLPAYRIAPGEALDLKVIRRGDPDPEPDRLSLNRTLWLDFDGEGYTIKDQIRGSMTRGWRLEAMPELALGRISVDGQPQFITRLPDAPKQGVEVRRGAIRLVADSRYEEKLSTLPAVGWDHDFQQVSATLNLPPGWDLFAATGVDNVPNTWLQRWTLLDLFLVLIATLAAGRLFGWGWGGLALLTLGLLWHEPGAPRLVWLNLLAAIALLRVLPVNRLSRVIGWYRNLTLLALVLIAVPFMINHVRIGLFPQLERPWQTASSTYRAQEEDGVYSMFSTFEGGVAQDIPQASTAPAPALEITNMPAKARVESMSGKRLERETLAQSDLGGLSAQLQQYDPKANVQTGPGLPQWSWSSIPLTWQGPVERAQEIRLILFSPGVNLFLNLLRVLLLVALALVLAGLYWKPGGGVGLRGNKGHENHPKGKAQRGTATMVLGVALAALAPQAQAEYPTPELLEELQTRLLEPPECLPDCAQSPRMRLDVMPNALSARIEVHTQQDVAVPLPGHIKQWWPQRVVLNGLPAKGLFRDRAGTLWIDLKKGRHQITVRGPLNTGNTVQLPLPLTPHRVEVQAQGWVIDGVHEDGLPDDQLQLTRIRSDAQAEELPTLEPGTLPAFVRVERTLHLGLDWHVETRVVNLFPSGGAVVLEIPLLEGESVTTEGLHISNGKVLVNMRGASLYWQSVLEKQPNIALKAPDTPDWSEYWRADIGPTWHVRLEGIPVIHHKDPQGQWLPEWRPWPGESVSLSVSRPEGVEGQTLTIDYSKLEINPGQRATDVSLALRLRSSQGGQHTLELPEQARLLAVVINGTAQPVRQEGRSVTLPVTPGRQDISLSWREPHGIGTVLRTPLVNLGTPSVNAQATVNLGADRWVLFLGGPRLGPAVMFWGVVLVIILIAIGLGRVPLTPLKTWHWLLLGIGLSQTPVWLGLIVVGWLLALGARGRLKADTEESLFNGIQIGLVLLTLIALGALFFAVQQGLLGVPEMQIAGNSSSAYQLNWFQDRADETPPRAWVLSTHLLVYRLLMLAWALWLAFSLLRWLRWGWGCFETHGLWRKIDITRRRGAKPVRSPTQTGAAREAQAPKEPHAPQPPQG